MRITLLIIILTGCNSCNFKIEAETSSGEHKCRSNASNERTLRLEQGEKMEVSFTISENCHVSVKNCCYSDDNSGDELGFFFNDHHLGNYEITNTENDNGEEWNKFKCSGEIGKPYSLSQGKHEIVVAGEKVDYYGVELDYVLLELDCASNQTSETSDCPVGLISITQGGGSDDSCDGSDSNSGKTSILGIPEIVGIVVSICTLVIATLGFCFGVYKWKHRNKNNYLQIQHYD